MILVLGGAGYIGSHTVKHLLEHGQECLVADNLIFGHREAVDARASFVKADLMDKASLRVIFEQYPITEVIHFAAFAYVGESVSNPQKYYHNNLIGTLNLLDVMLEFGVKRIVFSSTCATYGEPQYTPIDEAHPQNPINPYGKSKLMIESVLADYHHAYDLRYIALRYFNAAGAASDGEIGESHDPETHLIPLVLQAIKGEREHITVFGSDYDTPDGTCVRDYIHVEDLALAHRLALKKLNESSDYSATINLGTGVGVSVKDIISTAERVTGRVCPTRYAERRAGDPAKLFADNTKAKSVLGWQPQHADIATLIQHAWAWEQHKKY